MRVLRSLPIAFLLMATTVKAEMGLTVEGFVTHWYSLFDSNAPVEEFLKVLANEELEVILPEATLRSHQDFKNWYSGIQERIKTASHEVISFDYFRFKDHWRVNLDVIWRATEYSGKQHYLRTDQIWDIHLKPSGYIISKYIVNVKNGGQENYPPNACQLKKSL